MKKLEGGGPTAVSGPVVGSTTHEQNNNNTEKQTNNNFIVTPAFLYLQNSTFDVRGNTNFNEK